MSATGRGGPREELDFYPTPGWAIDAILQKLELRSKLILEPAAGDGAIVRRLLDHGASPNMIRAIELSPERAKRAREIVTDVLTDDYLATPIAPVYDLVITNPPYLMATQFARKALEETSVSGGTVALLLRLNWLGSMDRAAFHRAYPSDIYLLPKRPEFCASMSCSAKCGYREKLPIEAERPKKCPGCSSKVNCSTTDATEYAWFVWGPGRGGRWQILNLPSLS